MSSNATRIIRVTSPGIPVAGLLGVLFVALKLIGVISWPWIWVLAPFWAGLALLFAFLAVVLVIFLVGLIVILIKHLLDNRKRRK